ncbi:phage holin family protein [Ornithobacterium rhinotracheale]|uniref:Putative membrane protein n=1 Tax=Ornithobacterium rhinotracheale (strain ATCC 51463 / DSM 15997 / CCUG 23171 / CIP 104009 / LMG 9086) TaxID=867902 RepID=I3ZXK9_ORNRL|nr:phage holin family protein [Ornithobacterium rhinotracheale]AFL96443.1 putative membrane protein [Ornithobacterium rhinotracheale DSM 15997]AIP98654.1 membrane protein [Ornithobacterium rhinotracheale ORT-UMN 88]KGB67648.1 membrane protein [Ornithobacterium rhinotracheale H06-030791]MBN3662168.1 phage holin family protein [Ornithobacterium rhinotracheale]MCK0194771.1 phage holin family protein [Ornithobacterium rhinotracheale]
MNLIINLLVTSAVAYFLANNLSGVHINSFGTAIVFSIVLGLLSVTVKPILSFFSLPLTVLTLGLFLLVINAIIILLCSALISGFSVDGFWWAMLFSLILSVLTAFVNSILGING